ncbi:MAG: 5'-methylthioadenosine/adenosylhomocysteine nucleosidase [Clostridiales bacterium]|nr:5'-methylthioadenosine/adenosylhomocysteine nucleosidase [Clostridiales bacterium]
MIGIIGAMSIEIDEIIKKLDNKSEYSYKDYAFTCGTIYNKEIVVCKCGIGKVNASTATMLMKVKYDVDVIINIGVAGGYKTLKQGDIVISTQTVEHDYDGTPDGLVLGQVHGFDSPFLDCDANLVDSLSEIASERGYSFVAGIVATGDQFIASSAKSASITQTFGAVAYDMESGAINHTCKNLGIRFVAIRAISDNGNDEAVDNFYAFVQKAAIKSEDLVCSYISSL